MNEYFIVELYDIEDGNLVPVLCKNNEFQNLVGAYDRNKYKIANVHVMGNLNMDYKEFIKKEEGLETGG